MLQLAHAEHLNHTGGASWADLWSPGMILLLVIIAILYLMAVGSWRHSITESAEVPATHKFYFLTGLLCIYAAVGSPLSYYGHHYSFSAHMLQQSLLYLIAPPLLLMGTPGWLLRPLFRHRVADWLMKVWTHPLLSLFVFNLVFSFYHIPVVMNYLMENEGYLLAYNTLFLISAFQMWFPIFGTLPEYTNMSGLKKMGYIFLNGILLTPACALIIFADEVMYEMYANVPSDMMIMSAIDDQQLGGVIMKIVQEFVYVAALAHCFFRWYRLERKQDEEEELFEQQGEAFVSSSGKLNQA
ncbi:cytochrome c oxidase assembly protein [Paenibacillus hamazuiensis]|uniref:cytochrome c oxidase assembly protein n=1 Tax=Paenibacillus hamazuiensis TaxID=2936508 RepID=UPI00200ECAFC|nr:cytochrome c oxidase assembly protein [Paenibacillus hamazuiensis]